MIEFSDVKFKSEDELLDKLFNTALKKCEDNIVSFGDRDVLVEGGGYEKIWLETQPMGGRMYAKKNITVALNNQLMFMEYRRKDGRIPEVLHLKQVRSYLSLTNSKAFAFRSLPLICIL